MYCNRCGIEFSKDIASKRKERNQLHLDCTDCTMRPTKHLVKDGEWCRPHQGEVDDLLRPLDENGRLYKPGMRTCGHSDCVRGSHVLNFDNELLGLREMMELA